MNPNILFQLVSEDIKQMDKLIDSMKEGDQIDESIVNLAILKSQSLTRSLEILSSISNKTIEVKQKEEATTNIHVEKPIQQRAIEKSAIAEPQPLRSENAIDSFHTPVSNKVTIDKNNNNTISEAKSEEPLMEFFEEEPIEIAHKTTVMKQQTHVEKNVSPKIETEETDTMVLEAETITQVTQGENTIETNTATSTDKVNDANISIEETKKIEKAETNVFEQETETKVVEKPIDTKQEQLDEKLHVAERSINDIHENTATSTGKINNTNISVEEVEETEKIEKVETIVLNQETETKVVEKPIDTKQELLGEKLHVSEQSINDIHENTTNSEYGINNSIISIEKSISIGEKYLFANELFGNFKTLESTIRHIDQCGNRQEAVEYLQANFRWNNKEVAEKFIELVKRRYPN